MTDTKPIETKPDKTQANGTKPKETELDESLTFEVPIPPDEMKECLTAWLQEHREMRRANAIGYRVQNGMLMAKVKP